jgi:homoserine O-acetyltransferase
MQTLGTDDTDRLEKSVGIVTPQVCHITDPINLSSGESLSSYSLVYETYGELNRQRSNAILICHALTGDHHAAGYHSEADTKPGWWDSCIGPGKPIDTNKFYVVALNNLGGCSGSTGPNSINPDTNLPYGPSFPMVTVKDWVKTQAKLSDALGIKQWLAVVGGSLGGMQAMQWTIDYPERIKHCVVVAAVSKLSTQNIAFNEVARQAILSDPNFFEGHYVAQNAVPATGLKIARMLGHITYLSDAGMKTKFGRDLKQSNLHYSYETDFEIESYLRYQGEQFIGRFDANTYLRMGKALDYFDPAADFDNQLEQCFTKTSARFLVVSFTSDWRFSPERSQEIVAALVKAGKAVSYANVTTDYGHDAFLMPVPDYVNVLTAYLNNAYTVDVEEQK